MGSDRQPTPAQKLPPLATHDYEALRDDIARRGIIQPIIVNTTGEIIEGHHRWAIAQELGIDCPTQTVDVDEEEADVLAWALNFKRRSVSMDQKHEAALTLNRQGMTQEEIADRLGVAIQRVNDWLVTSSASGNSYRDFRLKVAPKHHAEIYERAQAGETQRQLAADYGVTHPAIGKIVKAETRRRENQALKEQSRQIQPPQGQYRCVVIDPPWPMKKIDRDVAPNQVDFDYPTMSVEEIGAMGLPLADEAHVYCWTTQKFLPDTFGIFKRWGINYLFTMTWHKPGGFQPFGLPQYNSEFVVVGRKGSLPFADTKNFFTAFQAPRTGHSKKPEEFYDLVRRVSHGPRIDMFNRRAIDGFEVWGNES